MAEERPGAHHDKRFSGETMNNINRVGHFVVRGEREGATSQL